MWGIAGRRYFKMIPRLKDLVLRTAETRKELIAEGLDKRKGIAEDMEYLHIIEQIDFLKNDELVDEYRRQMRK